MTNTHIPVFSSVMLRYMSGSAQDPAVLYERQYRNNWSALQRFGGGSRKNDCGKTLMNYSGWHLAAAYPRASKAVPGPVMVGTSGAHGKLKTL